MEFAQPLWLWGLLALPLLAVVEWWAVRRDRDRTARLVARPLWPRVVRRPAEAWRWIRLGLVLVASAGFVLALARPRWGMVREKLERQGVDVVLVADTSASMLCTDLQPSRFVVARTALAALLDRLAGDRFALVALEGEAYPLVPLTLDADAVGLFLDTMEPGIVPTPGTSLGAGLARALELFVDPNRANKVIVLASDGEDLEGGVEEMVAKAKQMGVVIHTIAVGTEAGGPVPDLDREGRQVGFKKDEDGTPVVSRVNWSNLEAMARATGGKAVRLLPSQPLAWEIVAAIEGMEQQTLAKEYAYRKKERFQWPLGVAVVALTLGLLLPPPRLRRHRAATAGAMADRGPGSSARGPGGVPAKLVAAVLGALVAGTAGAQEAGRRGSVIDEVLLRPSRATSAGRSLYGEGNYPKALERFTEAASLRPEDAKARFNLADALFKAGKLEEAGAIFRALGERDDAPLAFEARYNLGNVELALQRFPQAVSAYRQALKLRHDDPDTRRNLELALRAIQRQQQQEDRPNDHTQRQENQRQQHDRPAQQEQQQSKDEQERERFRREAGMPREQAMQLLSALEHSEKEQQRKQLQALRAQRKKGKDW